MKRIIAVLFVSATLFSTTSLSAADSSANERMRIKTGRSTTTVKEEGHTCCCLSHRKMIASNPVQSDAWLRTKTGRASTAAPTAACCD